jgi:hypothetical protein
LVLLSPESVREEQRYNGGTVRTDEVHRDCLQETVAPRNIGKGASQTLYDQDIT